MNADFKPKFIAWYEDDFRADRAVMRMTPVQRSLYRNLLIESYYNPLRPYLPTDDSKLWELADANDLRHWLDNKAIVLAKFEEVAKEDGTKVFQNKRVLEEWEILEKRLEQKKLAGAASVKARREKVKTAEAVSPAPPPQTPTQQDSTTPHNTIGRSTPVNERSTSVEAVGWVKTFFKKNFGQVLKDDAAILALFDGRVEEAVKGSIENWRDNRSEGFQGTKFPFSILVREFEDWYNPKAERDETVRARGEANAAAHAERQRAENQAMLDQRREERQHAEATASLI